MLLLTFVSSHIYLTTKKSHIHDKCNVHMFCLVSVFVTFLEPLLMVQQIHAQDLFVGGW